MADYGDRTEEATPRRRQKAKEKGQIPRSREFTSMIVMGGLLLTIYYGGGHLLSSLSILTTRLLSLGYGRDCFAVFRMASSEMMLLLAPMFAVCVTLAIVSNVAQGGFFIKPLEPDLNKINPLEGLQRMFSQNGLVEFIKNTLKFIVGVALFYFIIKKDIYQFPGLMPLDLRQLTFQSWLMIKDAMYYGFVVFFVISGIGYMLERWRFEQSIKMTKEEIKEETKETEGDPLVRSRIRMIQKEMSRKRMMQEVPKATVIVTNPTHLAVALLYDENTMSAPQVIAKGAGHIAAKIREIAKSHNIPIVEDKPLARLLIKIDLKQTIPVELFKAVARILAYVYKIKGKM